MVNADVVLLRLLLLPPLWIFAYVEYSKIQTIRMRIAAKGVDPDIFK